MANSKTLDKQIFKKWQFWVVVVAILGVIGLFTQDKNTTTTNDSSSNTNSYLKSCLHNYGRGSGRAWQGSYVKQKYRYASQKIPL